MDWLQLLHPHCLTLCLLQPVPMNKQALSAARYISYMLVLSHSADAQGDHSMGSSFSIYCPHHAQSPVSCLLWYPLARYRPQMSWYTLPIGFTLEIWCTPTSSHPAPASEQLLYLLSPVIPMCVIVAVYSACWSWACTSNGHLVWSSLFQL